MKSLWILSISLGSILLLCPAQSAENPIIFAEDFEDNSLQEWDADSTLNDPSRLRITDNPDHVFHGKYAAEFTLQEGRDNGVKLNKWFMPGFDRIYARFYAKFAEDFDQGNLMHWAHVMGNRVDNKWSSFGQAGKRPTGEDFFSIGIEPWRAWGKFPPPGNISFYTYHMDMPIDPKTNKYYGQQYFPEQPFVIERGRWYCYEIMVKANTPDKSDGEQILWIDGNKLIHSTGLRFRSSDQVRMNGFWLSLYIHDNPKTNTCWYDELVISHEPVGPLSVPSAVEAAPVHADQ
jgi:hypothetical protein